MRSILTAIIVFFGLILVLPSDQRNADKMEDGKVYEGSIIQDNFRRFFDSIGKNDAQKTKTYRGILKHETAKGQQAFDTMKEELQVAQKKKNVNRQRNSSYRNLGQNVVPSKREIPDKNQGSAPPDGPDGTTQDPSERSSKMAPLCADLKSYKQDFRMDEFIKTMNALWDLLYSYRTDATADIHSRITSEGNFNQILRDCGIRTTLRTEILRPAAGLQPAGIIDVRTLEERNTTHLIIKQRYKKPSCGALNQLLPCMLEESFRTLYPEQKVIALGFTLNLMKKEVISEWVALLYHRGEVLEAREQAKCIRGKEFAHLNYKGKPILEFLPKVNGTT